MNLLYHEDLRDYSMSDYLATIDKKDLLYKTWDVGDCWDQGPNNSCFPPDTLIRMSDGSVKNISDVKLLDEVVSAEGNIRKVSQLITKRWSGELITLILYGHKHLKATPEHPILTKRGYIPLKDLTNEDWVKIPKYSNDNLDFIATSNYLPKIRNFIKQEKIIRYAGVVGRSQSFITRTPIPDIIKLNANTGKIFGLFLAEGNTTASTVIWTFNITEKDTLVKELVDALTNEWNLKPIIKQRKNCLKVFIYGNTWSLLFEKLFSTGSSKKYIHPDILSGNLNFKKSLFWGWWEGDGHERRNEKSGTTVSKVLATNLYDIANFLNLRPAINVSQPKLSHGIKHRYPRWEITMGSSQKDTYRSELQDDCIWRKVKSLGYEFYDGYVYNMEVEVDHSYIAFGIGVHNCVGYACSSLVEADPKPVKPAPDPEDIFALAKKLDTKDRKGTGIREGLKALQSMGYVKSYYWTDQVTEVVVALLNLGPVVVGIDFYNSMRSVTDRMYASGGIAGQHAVLAYGVDLVKSDFLILNSHGPEWGRLGKARVSFNTMKKILKYGFAIEKP